MTNVERQIIPPTDPEYDRLADQAVQWLCMEGQYQWRAGELSPDCLDYQRQLEALLKERIGLLGGIETLTVYVSTKQPHNTQITELLGDGLNIDFLNPPTNDKST